MKAPDWFKSMLLAGALGFWMKGLYEEEKAKPVPAPPPAPTPYLMKACADDDEKVDLGLGLNGFGQGPLITVFVVPKMEKGCHTPWVKPVRVNTHIPQERWTAQTDRAACIQYAWADGTVEDGCTRSETEPP